MAPLALVCLTFALSAQAQMRPGLNLSGQTGLIDLPSGEQLADGYLSLTHSDFGPIARNALRFQITPRLSGIFRYVGLHDYEKKRDSGWEQAVADPSRRTIGSGGGGTFDRGLPSSP